MLYPSLIVLARNVWGLDCVGTRVVAVILGPALGSPRASASSSFYQQYQ